MNNWYAIVISFPSIQPAIIENINYLLFEHQAIGTEVKYAQEYLENHPNLFGEIALPKPQAYLDHPVEVWGYFDEAIETKQLESIEKQLKQFTKEQFELRVETIEQQNWQANWMKHYQIEQITRHLKILPAWDELSPEDSVKFIRLDPGIAFGTGNHPTTQLGGQALSIYMRGGERILDVGTGSGILSFIAGALGANEVTGVDLDPQAVESAKSNLTLQTDPTLNQLITDDRLHFFVNDLMTGIEGPYDIIIANILPHILVDMFDDAYEQLRNEGYLILGGILEEKGQEIEQTLEKYQFRLIQKSQLGEWLSYIVQKEAIR